MRCCRCHRIVVAHTVLRPRWDRRRSVLQSRGCCDFTWATDRASTCRVGDGCEPIPRWLPGHPVGSEPRRRTRHRRRYPVAHQRHAPPHGARRIRSRRHQEPTDRQGHQKHERRHCRARVGGHQGTEIRDTRRNERHERPRRDAAVRGVPEVAVGTQGGTAVVVGRLRLERQGPREVHGGDERASPSHRCVRPRHDRDRGLPAGSRAEAQRHGHHDPATRAHGR